MLNSTLTPAAIAGLRISGDMAATGRSAARVISLGARLNARLMTAPGPEHILELYSTHGRSFDAVNLSTAWGRISRAAAAWPVRRQAAFFSEHEPMLGELQATMSARLGEFGARELANTAYASACLSYEPALALLGDVRERAPAHSRDFKPQELANMAWGFAKAGVRSGPLFEMVERESLPKLAAFKPIELASLAWAFAKDGAGAEAGSDELFAGIAREAEARIGEFNARALFNLAWAFAATRRSDPRLFDAIAAAAIPECAAFSPHQIAVLAWAMGRARSRQPALVRALAAAAVPQASRLQPKHVVMLLWSAVRCGAADARLLGALSREVERTAGGYSPMELALVLWASAAARSRDAGPLFALAAARVAPEVRTCDGRALSLLAYASAVSGHAREAAPLLDALGAELPGRSHAVRLPDLVRIGWALAVARRHPPALLAELVARVNALEPAALSAQSAQLRVQLHQLNLSLRLLAPPPAGGGNAPLALAPAHAEACAAALRHDAALCAPSQLHYAVSAALVALRVVHDNEYVVPALGCTVDIAARLPAVGGGEARAVLIEVNGPHHYLPCGALRPTSALKHAHLAAAGWAVLSVRHDEWAALPAEAERLRFLRELLAAGRALGDVRGTDAAAGGDARHEAVFGARGAEIASASGLAPLATALAREGSGGGALATDWR